MIDYSMLQEFITEAGEHLDEMETDLLQLEVDPENADILNDIFREVHSIKGAAEYVGLEKTATLSHYLENLLELLRQGKVSVTNKIIDLLIGARDRMSLLNEDLDRFKTEKTEIKDILKLIGRYSGEDELLAEQEKNSEADIPDLKSSEAVASLDSKAEEHDEPACDSSPDDIYEEEYDAELFEIYLQQLKENITFIRSRIAQIADDQNPEETLDKVVEKIESLRSSANYMGYERLVDTYKSWIEEIRDAQEGLSLDEPVSFQFMREFVGKILFRFPQVQEALSETEEMEERKPVVQDNLSGNHASQGNESIDAESAEYSEELDFDEVVEKELDFLNDQLDPEKEIVKEQTDFRPDSKLIPEAQSEMETELPDRKSVV